MINQRIRSCIDELDVDENMKQFIGEILVYELDTIDEINRGYVRTYEWLVDKYLNED